MGLSRTHQNSTLCQKNNQQSLIFYCLHNPETKVVIHLNKQFIVIGAPCDVIELTFLIKTVWLSEAKMGNKY